MFANSFGKTFSRGLATAKQAAPSAKRVSESIMQKLDQKYGVKSIYYQKFDQLNSSFKSYTSFNQNLNSESNNLN